jgi:hypothetical protein
MERDHLGDPGVGVKEVILRQMFRDCNVDAWAGSSWLMIGTGGGNESSGPIKCGEFLDLLEAG